MGIRTYAWIARQPYNVRYMSPDNVLSDGTPESDRYTQDYSTTPEFKRGSFWPSLILVEKSWEQETKKSTTTILIRVYKRKLKLIIDVFQGNDMDLVTSLSEDYSVPIYRITTSRRGKRGSVQKLLDFQD
ncbi:MAG: hypothetical protein ACXAEU_14840 [Candidatus Hodarchaeales archaeon]